MTRYIYQGPVSSVTLKGARARLLPGKPVELPADDPYVATLVARGHLTALEALPPDAPSKTTKANKKDIN